MTSNCRKSLRFVFHSSAYGAERPFSLVIVPLKVESRIYVKYGLSIITSKILSKILGNENKKTGGSRKIVCFGILIRVLP